MLSIFTPLLLRIFLFLWGSILFAQHTLHVKVVDANDHFVPGVIVKGPGGLKEIIASGSSDIPLTGSKTKLAQLVDQLKFSKKEWRTVSVEFFEKENEVHVTLEPTSVSVVSELKTTSQNAAVIPAKDRGNETKKDRVVTIKVVTEKGLPVSELRIKAQQLDLVTSKSGECTIPASEIPHLSIKGYKIIQSKPLTSGRQLVVIQETTEGNIEKSIESVVNQVRNEQLQLEETNSIIVLEINNILKRLATEKALSSAEKKKLREYLKHLSTEISDGDKQYEQNKNKRDELLEKLNFLLLEKDSINKINQLKIEKLQLERELESKEASTRILVISVVALLLLAIIGIMLFLIRKVSRHKGILQLKNRVISEQKEKVQSVYKELSDNIASAKVIQNAILPGKDLIRNVIPDFSLFYQPRNIVSGDFYWFLHTENRTMLAAVDCTGHGVAGAFMSFLGYEILNQIATDHKEMQVGDMLSLLNSKLIETLSFYGSTGVNSGMDISLCSINFNNSTIEYAGANSPLYVIRKGKEEVEQFAADRQGIGGRQKAADFKFKTQILPFSAGDHFLLFSDGYADQLGGAEGQTKFMYNNFRKLFLDISNTASDERERKLEKQFSDWKGNYEQLDDVLVISFRL